MANQPPKPGQPTADQIDRLTRNLEVLSNEVRTQNKNKKAQPFPEEQLVEVNKSINRLNQVLRQSAAAIGKSTMSVGRFAAQSAKDIGSKAHEQVYYDAKQHTGRAGMAAGGLIGAVAGKALAESQTAQRLKLAAETKAKLLAQRSYAALKNAIARQKKQQQDDTDLVLSTFGEARQKGKRAKQSQNVKSSVSASKTYTGSPDVVAAIDRLRVSNIAVIRQSKTMAEGDVRKQIIPKAAKGGFVRKTGKAIVHAGEVIHPKTVVEKQLAVLNQIATTQQEQSASLASLNTALTDPEAAGGFFKTVGNTSKFLIPLFGGGMYKNDITRSTNPFVTMSSALLEMYRWQRLYGELSKRQLNELIKAQGGTAQDVYGKRGVFFEFLMKNRMKVIDKLGAYIDKKKKQGKGARLAKGANGMLSSWIGEAMVQDPELFEMRLREGGISQAEDMLAGKGKKSGGKKKGKFKSALGNIAPWTIFGAREFTPKQKLVKDMFPSNVAAESLIERPRTEDIYGRAEQSGIDIGKLAKDRKTKQTLEHKSKLTKKETALLESLNKKIDKMAPAVWKKVFEKEREEDERKTGGVGSSSTLENIDKNVAEIKKLIEQREGKKRKKKGKNDIEDEDLPRAAKGGFVKRTGKVVVHAGEHIIPDSKTKSIKGSIHYLLNVIAEETRKTKESLIETKNITAESLRTDIEEIARTIKREQSIDKKIADEKKLAEKRDKKMSVWEKFKKNPLSLVKNLAMGTLDVINWLAKHPALTTAALLMLFPTVRKAAMKVGGWVMKDPKVRAPIAIVGGVVAAKTISSFIGDMVRLSKLMMTKGVRAGWTRFIRTPQKMGMLNNVILKSSKVFGSMITRLGGFGKALGALIRLFGRFGGWITRLAGKLALPVAAITGAIDILRYVKTAKGLKQDYAKEIQSGEDANEIQNRVFKIKQFGSQQRRAGKSEKDISALQSLMAKSTLTDMDREFIQKLYSKGRTVTEIQGMIQTLESNRGDKKKSKDAPIVDRLIGIYGAENVLPLYNQIHDVSVVEQLLAKTKTTKENEFSKKYSQLIASYPAKKEEILTYMKAGTPPEQAAKNLGIKEPKPLDEKETASNENAKFKKKQAEITLAAHKKMISRLEQKAASGEFMTEEEKRILANKNKSAADYQKEIDIQNNRITPDVSAAKLDMTHPSSSTKKPVATPQESTVSKLTQTKNGATGSGKQEETKNNITRQPKVTSEEADTIYRLTALSNEWDEISKHKSAYPLGDNPYKESLDKKWKDIRARKVNDWSGVAKGIITNSGQLIKPAKDDVVKAEKANSPRYGYPDMAGGAVDELKKTPGRFVESLKGRLGNLSPKDIGDMVSGKKKPEDLLKKSAKDATYYLKNRTNRIKNLPRTESTKSIPEIIRNIPGLGQTSQTGTSSRKADKVSSSTSGDIYGYDDMAGAAINEAKKVPGRLAESAKGRIGNISPKDIGDMISGKKKVGDIAKNTVKDATYYLKNRANRIKNLPRTESTKSIPEIVKYLPKSQQIMQSEISPNRSELIKQNAVQEQLNQSSAAIRSTKKLDKTLEKSSNAQTTNMNNMISNITKISSNQSSGGGGGGGMNKLPLWKDIDSLLAGNNI